ncbi:MAG: hypothetical protein HN929_06965 [Chloroflexi bacterium]|jgi:hypothetical protein|nr:hypothetical protein [Chloroflexota bacterium]MBT7081188.1 hypothetical protein [Chloroflexota bacterium]MBT7290854.1 hypothetical protein [Chloroflexota bacterium]
MSREEERHSNKKTDQRYCTEHQTYYYIEFGCQQCAFDDFKPKVVPEVTHELKKCLKCGRPSLFFNSQNEVYECLNKKCKGMFTKRRVIEAEENGELSEAERNTSKKKKKKRH